MWLLDRGKKDTQTFGDQTSGETPLIRVRVRIIVILQNLGEYCNKFYKNNF
jgi:hypothetical protein